MGYVSQHLPGIDPVTDLTMGTYKTVQKILKKQMILITEVDAQSRY